MACSGGPAVGGPQWVARSGWPAVGGPQWGAQSGGPQWVGAQLAHVSVALASGAHRPLSLCFAPPLRTHPRRLTAAFTLRGLDVWPALAPAGAAFLATSWAALQACAPGSACNTTRLSAPSAPHAPLLTLPPVPPGVDAFTPTLTLLAPVCGGSRVALFGEPAKFATLSVQRFTALACSSAGVAMSLAGPAGETLTLAWWAPALPGGGAGMAFANATLPGSGGAPGAALSCEARADGSLACGAAAHAAAPAVQ